MASEPPAHHISIGRMLQERIFRLNQEAIAFGIPGMWKATLVTALKRLETNPHEAGDPLFRLKHLDLTCHRLMLDRTCIYYALHDWEHIVFLQAVTPVLDHPLKDVK